MYLNGEVLPRFSRFQMCCQPKFERTKSIITRDRSLSMESPFLQKSFTSDLVCSGRKFASDSLVFE